eukprot:2028950-Rhodomonas_salina.1
MHVSCAAVTHRSGLAAEPAMRRRILTCLCLLCAGDTISEGVRKRNRDATPDSDECVCCALPIRNGIEDKADDERASANYPQEERVPEPPLPKLLFPRPHPTSQTSTTTRHSTHKTQSTKPIVRD